MSALAALTLLSSCCGSGSPKSTFDASAQFSAEKYEQRLNLYVVADGGRNGYYEQKNVADQMGVLGEIFEPEVIVSAGDTHHFDGVESVGDPLWTSNFEEIYSHPELMVEWIPVLGNHEYRGNTQAVIDYSTVSRRWNMPSRYYTKTIEGGDDDATIRLVMIDTAPLIDKYRKASAKYPDAHKQDIEAQLTWLEKTLSEATEDWVIVVGHHPIYAYTTKSEKERLNMQERVDTILKKHRVDIYICGHIHSFQHIRKEGVGIDYIVNSSASLSREVEPTEGTKFCSNKAGFMTLSASKSDLEAMMIDPEGRLLYNVNRKR